MRIAALLLVVGTLLLGAVLVSYARELFAVDTCLDGGGSFDYAVGACDHKESHRYVPFNARHPTAKPTLISGGALVLAGLFLWKRSP